MTVLHAEICRPVAGRLRLSIWLATLAQGLKLAIWGLMVWIVALAQNLSEFMSVFTGLLIIQTLIYTERQTCQNIKNDTFAFLFRRFVGFWRQSHTGVNWFILLFLLCIPSSMVVSLFVPNLNELGWSAQNIGLLLTVAEPVAVMLFTPLSGFLLKKYSRFGLIRAILFLQIFLFSLFYVVRTASGLSPLLIAVPILLLSISYGLLIPCVLALLMDKSDPRLATLDSALQFSVVLFGAYLAGFFSLRLAGVFGYSSVYLGATLSAAGLWLFVRYFNDGLAAREA